MHLRRVVSKAKKMVADMHNDERVPTELYKTVIQNTTRDIPQYKLLIPRSMAKLLKMGKNTHKVHFILINHGTAKDPNYELKMELMKV
jgi:hypothetical protein